MLRKLPLTVLFPALLLGLLCAPRVYASLMGQVQGIVHDPGHRPIAGAHIELHAAHSALSFTAQTNPDGEFSIPAVPSGVYIITVSSKGFSDLQQTLTVTSNGADILHFQLDVAAVTETAEVHADPQVADVDSVTPDTMISRSDIEETPGAAAEMRDKLSRAGHHGGSIPVIDVRGQILVGFSASSIDRALAKASASTVL